jgi:hypothetical protein
MPNTYELFLHVLALFDTEYARLGLTLVSFSEVNCHKQDGKSKTAIAYRIDEETQSRHISLQPRSGKPLCS